MELIEQFAKQAGKAPSRAAAESLEAAFRIHGEAALEAARRGGPGLAAARHGDDVFRLAREVPAAAPALAAHADTLLPLARRYGNPVLEIATHAPGLADDAARRSSEAFVRAIRDVLLPVGIAMGLVVLGWGAALARRLPGFRGKASGNPVAPDRPRG